MDRITVKDLPIVGKGLFGTVYRLADDRIVKVANDISKPGTMERLEYEEKVAEVLYSNGIPTAQPFGLVETEDSAGVIYEMIKGQELYDFLEEHPEKSDRMIQGVADILLRLHKVNPGVDAGLLRMKDKMMSLLNANRKGLSEEEFAAKKAQYDALPERDTLVHGDLNPGNIIVRPDDSPVLIDVGSISTGHPYFEFTNMQQPYLMLEDVAYGWDSIKEHMMKTTRTADIGEFDGRTALLKDFYDRLFKAYFRDLNENESTKVIDNLKKKAFSKAVAFYARVSMPDEGKKKEILHELAKENEKMQSLTGPVEDWWPVGY